MREVVVLRDANGNPYFRYRPNGTKGPQRTRRFHPKKYGSMQLAEAACEAEEKAVKLRRRVGDVGSLAASDTRLDEFAQEWFREFVLPELAPRTAKDYAEFWDRHLLERVGHWTLGKCTTPRFAALRQQMVKDGLGEETIAKLLGILQAMFREAVLWGYHDSNPIKPVPKRTGQTVDRALTPARVVAPVVVEWMRLKLRAAGLYGDALLVCLLHYAGLRPGEALALDWPRVLQNTLVIDRALSLDEEAPTKNRRNRSVRLLKPLRDDVLEFQLMLKRPELGLVFPRPEFRQGVVTRGPRKGEPVQMRVPRWRPEQFWPDSLYRAWRRNVYQPTRLEVSGASGKPYDGRHSFASLLLHEGRSLAYVAEQIGDSIDTVSRVYLHVIDELADSDRVDAEKTIVDARALVARGSGPNVVPVSAAAL